MPDFIRHMHIVIIQGLTFKKKEFIPSKRFYTIFFLDFSGLISAHNGKLLQQQQNNQKKKKRN